MSAPVNQVPAARMMMLLDELAAFSSPGPGVTRLLYTEAWSKAQIFLQEKMASVGLETSTDKVGNVYGRLAGIRPEEPVILTGSHIDTVVNGGKYDGAYGVAAAVIALDNLRQTFGQPLRTLEVVSFCEEEGSRFPLTFWGSGHVTGLYDGDTGRNSAASSGVTIEQAMSACGFEGGPAERKDIGAYVELHIEQGIILENKAIQIGIVQAIAGQRRFIVKVSGTANHAGTTPMNLRRDALGGAAEMLYMLERLAGEAGEPLVATSGRLEVYPNTPNVIPGGVLFTLDIRHSEEEKLGKFCNLIFSTFEEIAVRRDLGLEIESTLHSSPAPMNEGLCSRLEQICQKQGRTYLPMVSGAGHDAQLFAPKCKTAMIFVPSQAGISHSPDEYSSPEDLTAGLEVLTALLYDLAYKE
ncbi:Zn-dependent hydrolase [Paenibacillus sp. sgz500958]|uniref:Zn-dependent hydrolase n=1 Tax=Paenibacillus sp. sgz500958 TaxID=3242475 RepID=UPI0036D2C190